MLKKYNTMVKGSDLLKGLEHNKCISCSQVPAKWQKKPEESLCNFEQHHVHQFSIVELALIQYCIEKTEH